jgi:hypothetical protein
MYVCMYVCMSECNHIKSLRFDVLMAVAIRNTVFWDVMPLATSSGLKGKPRKQSQ